MDSKISMAKAVLKSRLGGNKQSDQMAQDT